MQIDDYIDNKECVMYNSCISVINIERNNEQGNAKINIRRQIW